MLAELVPASKRGQQHTFCIAGWSCLPFAGFSLMGNKFKSIYEFETQTLRAEFELNLSGE